MSTEPGPAPEVSRADSRCCRDRGALPGAFVHDPFGRVLSQAAPADVIHEMCSACIAATFFGSEHPHDMSGYRRAARRAASDSR